MCMLADIELGLELFSRLSARCGSNVIYLARDFILVPTLIDDLPEAQYRCIHRPTT